IGGQATVRVTVDPRVNNPDPNRKAAEYVLSLSWGEVQVMKQGGVMTGQFKGIEDLPREDFKLTYVWLQSVRQPNLAGLAVFKDCKDLKFLHLTLSDVTDAELAYFKHCRQLNHLNLEGTQIGDAGLANFEDCKDLAWLDLGDTRVTDVGLAHFRD